MVISSLLPFQLAGLSANEVSNSPFVTVFNYIGIPYAEDIIRFVIITALLSAANSGLFAASRMMWSLSAKNQLPKIFSKLTPSGTPIVAITVTMFGAILDCFQNNSHQKQFLRIYWGLQLLRWLWFGLRFVFRSLTFVDSGISQEKQQKICVSRHLFSLLPQLWVGCSVSLPASVWSLTHPCKLVLSVVLFLYFYAMQATSFFIERKIWCRAELSRV